ncbi:hypothetical protein SBA4_1720005 [Candidatus Sulfopaludibacter sp. SbA4]|nr:hypothetical protein SBA4_1720005 [Candidatus Sulfopaludibacter sp. SbA4]
MALELALFLFKFFEELFTIDASTTLQGVNCLRDHGVDFLPRASKVLARDEKMPHGCAH